MMNTSLNMEVLPKVRDRNCQVVILHADIKFGTISRQVLINKDT